MQGNPYVDSNGADTQLGQLYKMYQEGSLNPVQRTDFERLSRQAGLNPGESYQSMLTRSATQSRMNAIAPAVASLEASVPELQGIYQGAIGRVEAQREPLKERYQVLLDEITAKSGSQQAEQTRITNQEFAKRGISTTSTMAQQELAKNIRGIQDAETLDKRGVVSEREQNLLELTNLAADLADKGVLATRDVRNMIAQLQAGAGNAAIDDTLNQMKLLADIEANKASIEAQKYAVDKQTAGVGREIIEAGGRKLLIDKITGKTIADLGAASTATTGGSGFGLITTPAPQSTVANQIKQVQGLSLVNGNLVYGASPSTVTKPISSGNTLMNTKYGQLNLGGSQQTSSNQGKLQLSGSSSGVGNTKYGSFNTYY